VFEESEGEEDEPEPDVTAHIERPMPTLPH
jgi:hypothetical protein